MPTQVVRDFLSMPIDAGGCVTIRITAHALEIQYVVSIHPGCRRVKMRLRYLPPWLKRVQFSARFSVKNSAGHYAYTSNLTKFDSNGDTEWREYGPLFQKVKDLRTLSGGNSLVDIRLEIKNYEIDYDFVIAAHGIPDEDVSRQIRLAQRELPDPPHLTEMPIALESLSLEPQMPCTRDADSRLSVTEYTTEQLFQLITECIRASGKTDLRSLRASIRELSNDIDARETILEAQDSALECTVCMDQPKNTRMSCGHTFCATCAQQVNRCPVCRASPGTLQSVFL